MNMNALALAPRPAAPSWQKAFQNLPREHGFEPLRVEGQLPLDLQGTLYRNGPAHFDAQGTRYRHWFDGDGAVSAVRFSGGRVLGAVRTVATPERAAEQRKGRMFYSNYGTLAHGGLLPQLRTKNAANTSVVVWQGRLFALFEAGLPTEISPEDLSTLGQTSLEQVIVETFSAHPHYVPQRRAAYNFGVRLGRKCTLNLYELPDTGSARKMATLALSGATMIHDFIATPNHLIFFAPPLRLQTLKMLLGQKSYGDALQWRPELGTEVIVVPIDRPDEPVRFNTDAFYQWHFANAFEQEGKIEVDFVRLPDFTNNRYLATLPEGGNGETYASQSIRATLNLSARRLAAEVLSNRSVEFPRVAGSVVGREHRYVYVAAHPEREASRHQLFTHLAKQDRRTGAETLVDVGQDCYPSEAVFVRRGSAQTEDDGYLLTLVYDGSTHTSHVAVLDARNLERGVIARAHFDHFIPFTFHGNFARQSE
jgi:all-trans-8'-apo-beta-carotenal 15,15'-oxygenase